MKAPLLAGHEVLGSAHIAVRLLVRRPNQRLKTRGGRVRAGALLAAKDPRRVCQAQAEARLVPLALLWGAASMVVSVVMTCTQHAPGWRHMDASMQRAQSHAP